MDSSANEIAHEFPPFFRVYKDGRLERLVFTEHVPRTGGPSVDAWMLNYVPPAVDSETGVESRDVLISPETGVKVRIFMPKINGPDHQKLPLLLHYHGGGFCIGSALDTITRRFLTSVASKAHLIAVSVEYRLAPEHPLPIAYDDSWSALQWIATHSTGQGPDQWLNQYVDFERVFLLGESAGANIAHHVAVRVGATGLDSLRVCGAIIVHPYFGGSKPDKRIQFLNPGTSGMDDDPKLNPKADPELMFQFMYPGSSGTDNDPKLNPKVDPDLAKMGCSRVLVFVAGKDWLKPRGVAYCETLGNSGWKGSVELVENEGEDHCFHMFNPTCESAVKLVQKVASFINQD